jgi:hypothetical protein
LSGETLGKCHLFFAAAAKDAGVVLADHLKVRARSSGPRKSRKSRNGGPSPEEPPAPSSTAATQKTMREMLLAKFPEFNPEWSDDIQAKWFAGFEKLMKSTGEDQE